MGKTLSHQECPSCGSKDNLKIWLNEEGIEKHTCKTPNCRGDRMPYTAVDENGNLIKKVLPEEPVLMIGSLQELTNRGISKETCEYYDYRVEGKYHIMNYPNGDQKIRLGDGKDKKIFWTKNREKTWFFGQDLTFDFNKELIICEGEIDCMSLYQVNPTLQTMSVRDGAGSLLKQIIENKDWLELFSSIVILLDNDKAGNEEYKKVLEYSPLKLKFAIVPQGEDPNSLLMSGRTEELLQIIKDADYPRPNGLVTGSEIDFDTLMEDEPEGLQTPFPIFNSIVGGIHQGRLYVVGGGTGTGKSTFLRELCYYLIVNNPGIKIANLFLEEKQKTTVKAYVAMDNNIPLHKLSKDKSLLSPKHYQLSRDRFGVDNLMFTSASFELNSKELFKQLDYLALCKKYDIIILDHISMVAGTSNVSKNGERRDIDDLMYKMVSIITKTNTTVLAAVHLTDPPVGKDYEEGRIVKMSDFRGSGAIKQTADVCIGLERNMMNEEKQSALQVRILKNRVSARLGAADVLYYINSLGRYEVGQ